MGEVVHEAGYRAPLHTVGEIFRRFGDAYRSTHGMSAGQYRTMWRIERCRTAALGGHVDVCGSCDWQRPAYNSCRDRHCPKCQGSDQAQWLSQRYERLLPVPYFHVVMTLPGKLRPLVRANQRLLYTLLMRSASNTLLDLARDPKWMGGVPAITSVLHTWTRKLTFHPHVHSIITGGGLSLDGTRWLTKGGKRFLFPVKVISKLFRGKFLDGLVSLRSDDKLVGANDPEAFANLIDQLYRTEWVSYAKRPFAGPQQVYGYLGRYTHRVGLSDYRLRAVEDDGITFATKNEAEETVAPPEFIRRFLQHVLPSGFTKIRHSGLYAASNVNTKLRVAQALLGEVDGESQEESADFDLVAIIAALTRPKMPMCPECGGAISQVPVALPVAPNSNAARAPPSPGTHVV